jgi:hypothetical protein
MTIIYSYTGTRSFVRKNKNKNLCGCLPELTAKVLRDIASWNRLAGQSEVAVPKPAPPSGIRCECWPVTAASRCFRFLFLSARVNVPFTGRDVQYFHVRSSLRHLANLCY